MTPNVIIMVCESSQLSDRYKTSLYVCKRRNSFPSSLNKRKIPHENPVWTDFAVAASGVIDNLLSEIVGVVHQLCPPAI